MPRWIAYKNTKRVITKPAGNPRAPAETYLTEDTPLSSFYAFIHPDPVLQHTLVDHHFPVFSSILLCVCFKVKKWSRLVVSDSLLTHGL